LLPPSCTKVTRVESQHGSRRICCKD